MNERRKTMRNLLEIEGPTVGATSRRWYGTTAYGLATMGCGLATLACGLVTKACGTSTMVWGLVTTAYTLHIPNNLYFVEKVAFKKKKMGTGGWILLPNKPFLKKCIFVFLSLINLPFCAKYHWRGIRQITKNCQIAKNCQLNTK